MKTVMIGGKFDPFHEGHLDHMLKAYDLGDFLYMVTHEDDVLRKLKGKCNLPLFFRIEVLKALMSYYRVKGEVMVALGTDGTMVKTLDAIKPDIFAKGGDRTPNNMIEEEVYVCRMQGIEIVYGIGDKLNSSSEMEL